MNQVYQRLADVLQEFDVTVTSVASVIFTGTAPNGALYTATTFPASEAQLVELTNCDAANSIYFAFTSAVTTLKYTTLLGPGQKWSITLGPGAATHLNVLSSGPSVNLHVTLYG